MDTFNNEFATTADIEREFAEPGALAGAEVLYADYSYENYEGSARVVYRGADGLLYEVVSGHCSCYGLEDTWQPVQVTVDALALRSDPVSRDLVSLILGAPMAGAC